MGGNPYHDQHIAEFTACMEQAIFELQAHYDNRFKAILDYLEQMEKRIADLENAKSCPGEKNPRAEAELVVTKESLKKMRDAFMSFFR